MGSVRQEERGVVLLIFTFFFFANSQYRNLKGGVFVALYWFMMGVLLNICLTARRQFQLEDMVLTCKMIIAKNHRTKHSLPLDEIVRRY